jgi:hypothetical protein
MHAEIKITVRSHKHSFTPYPFLSPYSPTDGVTEKQIHSLRVGWRNFFSNFPFLDFCFLIFPLFLFFEFWFGDQKKCPSSRAVSHCATSALALATHTWDTYSSCST